MQLLHLRRFDEPNSPGTFCFWGDAPIAELKEELAQGGEELLSATPMDEVYQGVIEHDQESDGLPLAVLQALVDTDGRIALEGLLNQVVQVAAKNSV